MSAETHSYRDGGDSRRPDSRQRRSSQAEAHVAMGGRRRPGVRPNRRGLANLSS